jgi:nucleoside-diphosphate-sugar epimerase
MNIFLTGGTGFIGSHFINAAHESGHIIYALKRKNSKPRIQLIHEPIWIIGDLKSSIEEEIIRKIDVLVHLAAHSANVPYDTIENCIKWNVSISNQFINQFLNVNKNIKLLIAGTSFEYGTAGLRYEYIPPDAPLEPTMSYPSSKAMSSILFRTKAIQDSLYLKYLRIFQIFGEGEESSRLWPSLHKAAIEGKDFPMTKGEQVRDFYYVKDLCRDIVKELDFSDINPGIPLYKNLGSGKPQTVLEFVQYWWARWNAKGRLLIGALPYRNNEVMRYVPKI